MNTTACILKSSDKTTLHQFPRLPVELRIEIWRSCISPRTVHVLVSKRGGDGVGVFSPDPVPAILHACREFRSAAPYKPAFAFRRRAWGYELINSTDINLVPQPYIWINFHFDTIRLRDLDLGLLPDEERARIRKAVVVVDDIHVFEWTCLDEDLEEDEMPRMKVMRALEDLTILSARPVRYWGTELGDIVRRFEAWFGGEKGWVCPTIKIVHAQTGDEMNRENYKEECRDLLHRPHTVSPLDGRAIVYSLGSYLHTYSASKQWQPPKFPTGSGNSMTLHSLASLLHLPSNVTLKELENFKAFRDWKATLEENLKQQYTDKNHAFYNSPYSLRWIDVQSVDRFGQRIGFIKLNACIERDKIPDGDNAPKKQGLSKTLPGIAFLRGGSVAMLMILRPNDSQDERFVVLTEQPRVPAGGLRFLEIPAGMIDQEFNFAGAAAKEIEEETGFRIPRSELVDMTELALQDASPIDKTQNAIYSSPGECDEFIALFLWEKELNRQEIEDLRGRLTGERTQSEMITLHVRKYSDLWKHGARNAKTLAAWALYEGLSRSGTLEAHKRKRKSSSIMSFLEAASRKENMAKRQSGGRGN